MLSKEHRAFLDSVDEYNDRYNSVQIGDHTEHLYHPFWSNEDIGQSEELKEHWDVSKELIPFYGDWHTLFCLNISTGSILYLNDDREVVHSWPTIEQFVSSLHNVEERPDSEDVLALCEDFELSPNLLRKGKSKRQKS